MILLKKILKHLVYNDKVDYILYILPDYQYLVLIF